VSFGAEHDSRHTAAETRRAAEAAPRAPEAVPRGAEATPRNAAEAGFRAVMVSIATPDRETARRLARLLVEGRLAACVQLIDPILSVYRWKGEVREEAEVLLLAKSSQDLLPRIGELLAREHPYELPELAAVPITDGSPPYLQWMKECLG